MTNVLVTGGFGFIGSNFIRRSLELRPLWNILNLDCLSYSGNPDNLSDLDGCTRLRHQIGSVADPHAVAVAMSDADVVVNFAAETHVDRSIRGAAPFVAANIVGTQVLLDALRKKPGVRFLQVGTDEVYGSLELEDGQRFREDSPVCPNSPYAASKAAADHLCRAYHNTYGLDIVTTRCSNNFGPYQFPEKLIPLFVTSLLAGRKVPVYGDGRNVRDWLHVDDHCSALIAVLERGRSGEIYNVGGGNELSNLDITQLILDALGRDSTFIDWVTDRPGHDRRYAVDATRIRSELGWQPLNTDWRRAMRETIDWYRNNPSWWGRILSGAYRTSQLHLSGAA